MADATASLNKYTAAVEAVEAHEKANSSIFIEHSRLGMLVLDARNELDDVVAEIGASVSNNKFKVTVTPQTQTIYDEEKILARLNMSRDQAIGSGLIKVQPRPSRIGVSKLQEG